MQNLIKIIDKAKKNGQTTQNDLLNIIRQYLQVLILKALYQSRYGKAVSFMGGTCLRICYDLRRFSEDLDFTYDRKISKYSFSELNSSIVSFLQNSGFEVDVNEKDDAVVQKSFIRIEKVLHHFGLSPLPNQKIHVKLEIDTNPVPVSDSEIEPFFVTQFDEMFPILKHTKPTLFAGKIGATLNREYTKGRDFYDLIWYLNQGVEMNLEYLNKSQKQGGLKQLFRSHEEVIEALRERVKKADVKDILKDIGRFLEDESEERWIQDYPLAFKQAAEKYLARHV